MATTVADRRQGILITGMPDGTALLVNGSGVIGYSGIVYDSNGSATERIANAWELPMYSWFGNAYQYGSTDCVKVHLPQIASTFAAFGLYITGDKGNNASGNGTAVKPLPDRVKARWDSVGVDGLSGTALRNITYYLYGPKEKYDTRRGAIIKEQLVYEFGQQPQPSNSPAGQPFDDQITTRGRGSFILTQRFLASVPGFRDYPVKIVPCIGDLAYGAPVNENHIVATAESILVNLDAGVVGGRTCRE
jgi:hypothetical protein